MQHTRASQREVSDVFDSLIFYLKDHLLNCCISSSCDHWVSGMRQYSGLNVGGTLSLSYAHTTLYFYLCITQLFTLTIPTNPLMLT